MGTLSVRRTVHAAYLRARHGPVVRALEELEKSQWLPPEEIARTQGHRLRALLAHAATQVPHYRRSIKQAGLSVEDIKGAEALRALPVVTKSLVRDHPEELTSKDATERGARENATGGSTGEPLRFLQDRRYHVYRRAAMYRGFRWCGWTLGGPLAYLWGIDPDAGSRTARGRVLEAFFGIKRFNAFDMPADQLDGILDALDASDPDILIGYASSLRLLARHALSRGGGPSLRAVESSAEVLDPDARAQIEKAFRCRVLDRYGCREAGVIAHECAAGEGWHINAETTFVEIEPDGGLLVTPLMNYSMPLIRYRNEDLAVAGETPCSCGRGLPVLSKIIGRRSDLIRSPSGKIIHGEFFTHLFYQAAGVSAFQVVQTDPESLTVSVVADAAFNEGERSKLTRIILEHGDPAFRVVWKTVREIPCGPTGKHRFTISEVPEEHWPGGS